MAITKNLREKIRKYNLNVPTYKRTREYKNFLIQLNLNDVEYEFLLRETIKGIQKDEKNKLKQIKKFYDKTERDLAVLVNPSVVTINYKELRDIRNITRQDYFRAVKTIFNFAKNYSNNENRIIYEINDDEVYYTVNDAFIDSIGSFRIVDNPYGGSSDELLYRSIYDLENNPVNEITFTSIKRTNKYNSAEGAYFPYFCPNYDLSRFQIFKNSNDADLNDNCLIYALKLLGLDDFKLDLFKTAINNNNICKSKLKEISLKLKIQINLYEKRNDNKIRLTKYGETGKVFNIALFQNHYFIYEKYLDTNSLNFIKYLYENKDKYLIPFDYNNLSEEQLQINNIKFSENLEYSEIAIKEKSFKDKNNKYDKIIFADFETFTTKRNNKLIHNPYLLSFKYDNSDEIKSFTGANCAKSFIDYLNKKEDKNILIIFHNAKYDFNFLTKEIKITKEINSDGNFKSICGYTNAKIHITIKCSLNLFNLPLKKCPKAFMTVEEQKLIKKEVMPYNLYNEDGYINKRFIPVKDINISHFNNNNKDDYEQFFINAEEWNCYDPVNNTIDIIEYSRIYCEMDVLILSKSYNKFRDWVLDGFDLDVNNYLTISSIADAYFTKEGCYEGVNQISLNVQDFIMQSVYGGRVMTRRNEKIYIEDKINDFDAVSLYPSAMVRLGFPIGNPKIIKDLSMEFLRTTDAYFVEIEITKVGIKRDFPILSKYDNEIREYTNEMVGQKIIVNNITLEDLIKFHNIEFNIIKGYYYNEGFNYKIKDVIQYVFDKRAELKKNKNSAEIIYKLLMNSAYGKTIQKPHLQDYEFIYGDDKLGSYISKNYNKVVSYRKIPNSNGFKMTVSKSSYGHYNLAHIGSLILSMSKRIMNEVMTLAEDNEIDIYYQDTDSMHLKDADIPRLEKLFKETYKRELIGKSLGQFHSDFNIDDTPDGLNVYSKKLIALGKKCYIDILEGIDDKGNIYNDYHIRLKGVSNEAIKYEAKKRQISELDIYELLYKGQEIEFDLTCNNNKACFKFQKNYIVHTQTDFKRKIRF